MKRNWIIVPILLSSALLAFFQACSGSSTPVVFGGSQLASGGDGRGEGFDGKPTDGSYYRVLPNHNCKDKEVLYDEIAVQNKNIKATLTDTSSCEKTESTLTPTQLEYNAYSKSLIGYGDGVFEKKVAPPTPNFSALPELWCRSTDAGPDHGLDVIVHSDVPKQMVTADVIIGSLNANNEVVVQTLPTEIVARSLSNQSIRYTSSALELTIPVIQSNQAKITGVLKLTAQGTSQTLACRMAGALDQKSTIAPASCPVNYVLVPKLAGYSDSDFCVAKYEAKQNGSVGASQAAQTPWVNIDRSEAIAACEANGLLYDLISNSEWQALARDIESVPANWKNGALNRGHTDNLPDSPLEASSNDNDSCFGKTQSCSLTAWDIQRRTHQLSNAGIIWDLSGNVIEWVKDDSTVNYGPKGPMAQISNANPYLANTKNLFGPAGDYASLTSPDYGNLGLFEPGTAGALMRGGVFFWGPDAGIFETTFTNDAFEREPQLGFRCVYHP